MLDKEKKKARMRRYRSKHKEKIRLYNQKYLKEHPNFKHDYYVKNKEKFSKDHRRYKLKKRYGLTEEKYVSLLESQGNRCAICKEILFEGKSNVDHDHITGEVRGILCPTCNWGVLGGSKENLTILYNAIEYLEKYK